MSWESKSFIFSGGFKMSLSVSVSSFNKEVVQDQTPTPDTFTFYETSALDGEFVAFSATSFSATISAADSWITVSPTSAAFTSGTNVDTFTVTVSYDVAGKGVSYQNGTILIIPQTSAMEPGYDAVIPSIPVQILIKSKKFGSSTLDMQASYANPPLVNWGTGGIFRR